MPRKGQKKKVKLPARNERNENFLTISEESETLT